jgi:hypothetical protein
MLEVLECRWKKRVGNYIFKLSNLIKRRHHCIASQVLKCKSKGAVEAEVEKQEQSRNREEEAEEEGQPEKNRRYRGSRRSRG